MDKLVSAALILVGLIHLLPVSGVLGSARLSSLYGLTLDDPNLLILMQHRAVLFGLLGLFLLYAAFKPALQPLALAAGLLSVASFLLIAWLTGEYNPAIARVVIADWVALVALLAAACIYWLSGAPEQPG